MHELALYPTEEVDQLAWPDQHHDISLRSPAIHIFTDFTRHKPLVIEQHLSIEQVQELMRSSHVRLKIVINEQKQFVGLISLDDLHQQRVLQKLVEGFTRKDLLVTDFMRKKTELMAFDFKELINANVEDVIRTLKENGQHHCLVIDRTPHKIRGIISASDIARRLKIDIDIQKGANFIDIYQALHR